MSGKVLYRLLGPVEVTVDGVAVPIERPRRRAVLAYLLLHTSQLVTTDSIVEALWGGTGPSTARSQVQTDISIIRRVLRSATGTDPIATRAAGYALDVGDGRLDTEEFTA